MNVNKVVYNGNTLVDLTNDTVTADNLASGVTAHAADGSSVTGLLPKVEIDSELSSTSTNPVQNKVINSALANKMNVDAITSGFALTDATSSIQWRQGSQAAGSINATDYTGTSAKATADGNGDTISTTYAKLASENTWSALQTFNSFKTTTEKYNIATPLTISGDFVPTHAVEFFTASGIVTIDLTVLAYALANNEATVCTCVISSLTPYGLIIKGADNIVAIGSIKDIAIGEKGTVLNIIIRKENNYSYALVQGTSIAWW